MARVQATYLSHLVNFTRWEKRHLPEENEAPKIVVVGNENRSFVDSLEFLIKQNALRIEGQLVEFHYFENARHEEAREMFENKGAQLIYVLPNSSFTPREINDLTESAVVFGEGREFVTDEGGDVSFITVRNRVKLVVGEKYFKRTSPKLSSKLVNLKSVVEIIPEGGSNGPVGRKGSPSFLLVHSCGNKLSMIPSSKFFLGSFFRRISCSVFLVGFCSLLAFVSPGFSQSLDAEDNGTSGLSPFEQADLLRLIDLDIRNLSKIPIQGVLGFDQEYWRNPASVHVIRPEDVTLNGYLNSVEALRGVPGMHVTRGLAYDNFASMRNFSGFSTQKFLGKIGGREVSQLMLGSANYSVDDYPIAVIDRIEVIRGPGASIWGTNAVNGVINLVTKHSGDTQGDSFRIVAQDNGTFMGDYVHGGQVSEDSFYRVWARTQEYAEGTLDSGLPARDDGYLRKAGFRYDKELEPDLISTCPVDSPPDDSSMFWILRTGFSISRIQPEPLPYLLHLPSNWQACLRRILPMSILLLFPRLHPIPQTRLLSGARLPA